MPSIRKRSLEETYTGEAEVEEEKGSNTWWYMYRHGHIVPRKVPPLADSDHALQRGAEEKLRVLPASTLGEHHRLCARACGIIDAIAVIAVRGNH